MLGGGFRMTLATRWRRWALEAGVHPKLVQEQLGHSAIAVTLDTVSPRSAMLGVGVAIALLTVATGCSSDGDTTPTTVAESSSPSGTAVAAVLKKSTEAVLVDQNITLDGELACTGNLSLTRGTVTGSCAGADTDGNAIASTLDGTAKLTGVNSCTGTFIVTSAGEVINENKDFNCI